MKKIKIIAFIASLAMCITLLGVGYATWYNVRYPGTTTKAGTVESYSVLNITNKEMTIFKFSMLSFKTGTATEGSEFKNSDVGEITVTYTVDAETLATTNGNFCVNLSLGYDKTTVVGGYDKLFAGVTVGADPAAKNTVVVSCDRPADEFAATHINEGDEVASTYTFKGVTANDNGAFTFTATYTFNIPSADDNFRTVFGQYLQGGESGSNVTKFVASAHVTKVAAQQQ